MKQGWRWFTIRIKMRGTEGERRQVTRVMQIHAQDHADAITKATEAAVEHLSFEVKVQRP